MAFLPSDQAELCGFWRLTSIRGGPAREPHTLAQTRKRHYDSVLTVSAFQRGQLRHDRFLE